ncbi:MAG: DUF4833 domain-containing protein [Planctomycetes bacterium]|nr:DUF4833 domain-containing protein [Planctomycetota bacterium]
MTEPRKRKTRILRWMLFAGVPVVVAGLALAFFVLRADPVDTGPTLFIIQRSKNANEVHYEVQVNADGALADEPVIAYWVLKAESGGREDLSFFERKMAYGFEVLPPDSSGDREMKLVAWEDRTIRLTKSKDSGKWRAATTIDGERAYLTRLYIETDESGLTPTVLHIDLFGETVDGGDPVRERVVKE